MYVETPMSGHKGRTYNAPSHEPNPIPCPILCLTESRESRTVGACILQFFLSTPAGHAPRHPPLPYRQRLAAGGLSEVGASRGFYVH